MIGVAGVKERSELRREVERQRLARLAVAGKIVVRKIIVAGKIAWRRFIVRRAIGIQLVIGWAWSPRASGLIGGRAARAGAVQDLSNRADAAVDAVVHATELAVAFQLIRRAAKAREHDDENQPIPELQAPLDGVENFHWGNIQRSTFSAEHPSKRRFAAITSVLSVEC